MIDLITGHQGIPHISAEQISTLHRSLMGTSGDNTVIKMTGGNLAQAGLAVEISAGFWRVHGYDMEIQEGETVLFDPTESGYSRIDNVYVEVLQDISSGVQRAELVNVMGETSTTTPTAPSAPTEPENSYDILVVAVPVLTATITEGAMTFTDLTEQYENVTHEELSAVQTIAENAQSAADSAQSTATSAQSTASTANTNANHALAMIKDSDDAYSSSKSYEVGDYVIYNNTVYKCITACSAASWTVNQSNFEEDTIIGAVTDLNSALSDIGTTTSIGSTYGAGNKTITLANDIDNYRFIMLVFSTGGNFWSLKNIIIPVDQFKQTNASNLIRLSYDTFNSDIYYTNDTTISIINSAAACTVMAYGIK